MSHCHWLLRIPTRDEHASMNLGQAVAICLYELSRSEQRAAVRLPESAVMPAEDAETITRLLSEILIHAGYVQPTTSASSELKLRRLVRRLSLPAGDVDTWLGILRQILWKVKDRH
jgi:tRNA/rRNA methyltransferase